MNKKEKEIIEKINNSKKHKHKIKLAFNDDEIISYCEECGKILDVYKKVKQTYPVYYPVYYYHNWYRSPYDYQPIITCGSTTGVTGTTSSTTATPATANYSTLTSRTNTHI